MRVETTSTRTASQDLRPAAPASYADSCPIWLLIPLIQEAAQDRLRLGIASVYPR